MDEVTLSTTEQDIHEFKGAQRNIFMTMVTKCDAADGKVVWGPMPEMFGRSAVLGAMKKPRGMN